MANKFTSVLDSIGKAFKFGVKKAVDLEIKALPAEKVVAAVVTDFDPAVGTTLTRMLNVVGGIQQITTAVNASSGTGAQKLQAAIPGIEAVILADPIFAGKKIGDLTAFNTAVEDFASAFVDLVNSVESAVDAGEEVVKQATPIVKAATA